MIKAVKTANQVIELVFSTENVAEEMFLFQKLLIFSFTMETVKPEFFSELNAYESEISKNHRTKMVNTIASIFSE